MTFIIILFAGAVIATDTDIWNDETVADAITQTNLSKYVCIGDTCYTGYDLTIANNASIAGSPICTQANGYCAGQPAQGSGVANRVPIWLNGSHLTSDSDFYYSNAQLHVYGGDGAEPGYTFSGYTGTGMLSDDALSLAFTVDEKVILELESGAETYGARITQSTASDTAFVVQGTGVTTGDLQDWRNTAGTTLSVIDEDGYLGIGSSNPDTRIEIAGALSGGGLHLDSSDGAGVNLDKGAVANNAVLTHSTAGVNKWQIGTISNENYRLYDVDDGTYPFIVEDGAPDDALRIDADGNIGVGMSNPLYEIDVDRGTSDAYIRLEGDPPTLWFESETYNSGARPGFYIKDNNRFTTRSNGGQNIIYDFAADWAATRTYDAQVNVWGAGSTWNEFLQLTHDVGIGKITTGAGGLTLSSATDYVDIDATLTVNNQQAAQRGLSIVGAAAQSAYLQSWEDNSNNVLAYVNSAGTIGAEDRLSFYGLQDKASGTAVGVGMTGIARSPNSMQAISFSPYIQPEAANQVGYGVIMLTRAGSEAYDYDISQIRNYFTRIDLNAGYDSVITGAYNFFIANPGGAGTGNITNLYGLYVADLTKGTNDNYAIYTAGSTPSYLGGNVKGDSDLNVTGNTTVNVYYGEMNLHNETNAATPLSGADTYANVTQSMKMGHSNGFTYSTGVLTALVAGTYKVTIDGAFSGTASQEYHITLGINGVASDECHIARVIGTGGDIGAASSSCLVPLSINDELTIMVENKDSAGDPTFQDASLTTIRIGATT